MLTGAVQARASQIAQGHGLRLGLPAKEIAIGIAEKVFLHLSHCIAGKVIHEKDPFRQLVIRKAVLQRLDHVLLLEFTALRRNHNRHDFFAEVGVRHTNDRALEHAGQGIDLALDFLGIDIEAAGDDEVLAAPYNVDIAT